MNSKPYLVSFQLWDITNGEAQGDLLRDGGEFEISGLNTLDDAFWQFCQTHGAKFLDGEIKCDPLSIDGMRVSMSRNAGQGILRTRIEAGKKLFRIDTRARRVERVNILKTLYSVFSTPTRKAVIEMSHDDGVYWVSITYKATFSEPSSIAGIHPLTGQPCSAVHEGTRDAGKNPTCSECLYMIED